MFVTTRSSRTSEPFKLIDGLEPLCSKDLDKRVEPIGSSKISLKELTVAEEMINKIQEKPVYERNQCQDLFNSVLDGYSVTDMDEIFPEDIQSASKTFCFNPIGITLSQFLFLGGSTGIPQRARPSEDTYPMRSKG